MVDHGIPWSSDHNFHLGAFNIKLFFSFIAFIVGKTDIFYI